MGKGGIIKGQEEILRVDRLVHYIAFGKASLTNIYFKTYTAFSIRALHFMSILSQVVLKLYYISEVLVFEGKYLYLSQRS